jgi:large repetitive protein
MRYLTLLILIVFLFGCGAEPDPEMKQALDEGTISSDDTTVDSWSVPSGTVIINNGDESTSNTVVNLKLYATDSRGKVGGYYASETNSKPSSTASGWSSINQAQTYSDTVDFTVSSSSTLGTFPRTVYVWFKDTSGNVSDSDSDSINLVVSDTSSPSSASVNINSGSSSSTSTSVSLTISATDNIGVTTYYASESSTTPSSNSSGWVSVTSTSNYSSTVSFTFVNPGTGSFSRTVYVWFKDEAGNVSDYASDSITLVVTDVTSPVVAEVTPVTTPTSDSTPNYTFSSNEAGTITYGGSCSSSTTSASSGNNTITMNTLDNGTYSDCTIRVTDSSGNVSYTLSITSFSVDLAPVIAEVTAVTTPSNDYTPDYTFSSTEAGTITYGGSCSSSTTSASSDNNTITMNTLSNGTYSDCTIRVTDSGGNVSNTLSITSFTIYIDTTAPTVASISPTDNQTYVSRSDNVSVTFSEAMEVSLVTTNTSNTSCSGSLQVSSDNFSTCIQMSSAPTASNSNKTFTVDPAADLPTIISYQTRVTTTVKDVAGNNLSSQYQTTYGFKTNLFVAVGEAGTILISSDATNWTPVTNTSGYMSISAGLGDIIFENGTYVAVGNSGAYISTNGVTWTLVTNGISSASNVAFGNNKFVAGAGVNALVSSDNGTSWSSYDTGFSWGVMSMSFGNNIWVTGSQNGEIATSSDAQSWTTVITGLTGSSFSEIIYENNIWVVVGRIATNGMSTGDMVSSTDLSIWSRNSTSYTAPDKDFFGVAYGNGLFVAVGCSGNCSDSWEDSTGEIYTSANGINWTKRTSGTQKRLFDVTFANNKFVVVGGKYDARVGDSGGKGIVLTSPDGITWTTIFSDYLQTFTAISGSD